MKANGWFLILLGIVGAIFVLTYDVSMGKPVNDITGPKSIAALAVCAVFVILGLGSLLCKKCCKK